MDSLLEASLFAGTRSRYVSVCKGLGDGSLIFPSFLSKLCIVKKLIFYLLFLVFTPLFSQKVENVKGVQVDKKAVITYDLINSDTLTHYVSLSYSTDGGRTFSSELKRTSGDVRNNISPGVQKKITWDIEKELGFLQSDVVFKVNAEVKGVKRGLLPEVKKQQLLLASVGWGYRIEVMDCNFEGSALVIEGYITRLSDNEKNSVGRRCTSITNERNVTFSDPEGKVGNVDLGEQSLFVTGAAVPIRLVFKETDGGMTKLTLTVCIGENKIIKVKNIPIAE